MQRLFYSKWVATIFLLSFLAGCSSESNDTPAEKQQTVIPPSFDDAGLSWAKADSLTEQDTQSLTRYFSKHPSVAENSIVNGDPLIYVADEEARRFYWVRSDWGKTEWLCLEFDQEEVTLTEGQGAPFVES